MAGKRFFADLPEEERTRARALFLGGAIHHSVCYRHSQQVDALPRHAYNKTCY